MSALWRGSTRQRPPWSANIIPTRKPNSHNTRFISSHRRAALWSMSNGRQANGRMLMRRLQCSPFLCSPRGSLGKPPPDNPWCCLYSLPQDVGFIGDDGTVGGALQSTTTVRRLAFGAAGFTALMTGVQAGGKRNRTLRASSDREMSSANSWTDASNVRRRARAPTTTPLATPMNVMAPFQSFRRTTGAI
jgi:hypothetical protein